MKLMWVRLICGTSTIRRSIDYVTTSSSLTSTLLLGLITSLSLLPGTRECLHTGTVRLALDIMFLVASYHVGNYGLFGIEKMILVGSWKTLLFSFHHISQIVTAKYIFLFHKYLLCLFFIFENKLTWEFDYSQCLIAHWLAGPLQKVKVVLYSVEKSY